uniref:Uncharacterized protein n=1 Tax=Macaca mulatta TaxID=9544 RepID=A0A5F7Z6Y3_MACMU
MMLPLFCCVTPAPTGFKTVRAGGHLHNYQGFRNLLHLALGMEEMSSEASCGPFTGCATSIAPSCPARPSVSSTMSSSSPWPARWPTRCWRGSSWRPSVNSTCPGQQAVRAGFAVVEVGAGRAGRGAQGSWPRTPAAPLLLIIWFLGIRCFELVGLRSSQGCCWAMSPSLSLPCWVKGHLNPSRGSTCTLGCSSYYGGFCHLTSACPKSSLLAFICPLKCDHITHLWLLSHRRQSQLCHLLPCGRVSRSHVPYVVYSASPKHPDLVG